MTTVLPVLPLRDIVVFPNMIVPLFVGRDKSVKALEQVMSADKQILLVAQKDANDETPSAETVYDVGVVAQVLQLLKLPDGTVKVLIEGKDRVKLNTFKDNGQYFQAKYTIVLDEPPSDEVADALMRSAVEAFEGYIRLNKKVPTEALSGLNEIEEPGVLADTIASHLLVKNPEKQDLLETLDVSSRIEKVLGMMEGEISVMQVEKKIRNRVRRQMERTQREYYLTEQMKAIQKELGEGEEGREDIAELEKKLKKAKPPKEVRKKAQAELKKLSQMNPMSSESSVVRNYLEWLLSIPWNKRSPAKVDLDKAHDQLEGDHYGLEKVKDRILDHLAVQARTNANKGPILCLVGPPGVGKTSLARSIAEASGREFARVSLGGVRDEAEIRGHRRTYVGSMPGRMIQSMKKLKTVNPLILLDEIDKMGMDFRGDPAAALLEVLDPEQNKTFNDHYLEVDYDLSEVMFITTANTFNMPSPLLDRMEIIRIPGYTEDEKVEIAKRHLMPKVEKEHALSPKDWHVPESILRILIRTYTREAGVRGLERELAKLARKTVRELAKQKAPKRVTITPNRLAKYCGVPRYTYGQTEQDDMVGVVTGLAWSEVGGDTLTIEAVQMPGRGKMSVTGNLKDVMKESISAANAFVQSRAPALGIHPKDFRRSDMHVHVPEGAVPKDGPSAGIAMVTAIVSAFTDIPVRKDVAMTGEVTLRGRVLKIGGLKEKLLAALRAGVKTVIIPKENETDLVDIPQVVKGALEIIPVRAVDEVLSIALTAEPTPIEWTDADLEALDSPEVITAEDEDIEGIRPH